MRSSILIMAFLAVILSVLTYADDPKLTKDQLPEICGIESNTSANSSNDPKQRPTCKPPTLSIIKTLNKQEE